MDFAPRQGFDILASARLHAIIMGTGLIGSPIPKSVSDCPPGTDSSSSGNSAPVESRPHAGAAASSFNLDACFTMAETPE